MSGPRLGRTTKHLIEAVTTLRDRGIGFKSLTENIDTTTSGGKLIFHIFGSLAEFERDLIRERTQAGLQAARARGRNGGRPKSPLSDEKKLAIARKMYLDHTIPVKDILTNLGMKKTTFYKYLKTAPQPTEVALSSQQTQRRGKKRHKGKETMEN
jgi:DNA invertase Pin-like site-specific DNA recombinase